MTQNLWQINMKYLFTLAISDGVLIFALKPL